MNGIMNKKNILFLVILSVSMLMQLIVIGLIYQIRTKDMFTSFYISTGFSLLYIVLLLISILYPLKSKTVIVYKIIYIFIVLVYVFLTLKLMESQIP